MEMVVRMDGMVAQVLERLVERGYYKTKAEALRAGVLELGREYRMFDAEEEARLVIKKIQQLEQQEKEGKIKFFPLDDIIKEAGLTRKDLE